MQTIATIGLDIAKSVFRVHGVDAAGLGRTIQQSSARSRRSSFCNRILLAPSLASVPSLIISSTSPLAVFPACREPPPPD